MGRAPRDCCSNEQRLAQFLSTLADDLTGPAGVGGSSGSLIRREAGGEWPICLSYLAARSSWRFLINSSALSASLRHRAACPVRNDSSLMLPPTLRPPC